MKKCALGIMVFLVCVILTIGLYAGEDLIYVVERGDYINTGELSKVEGTTVTTLVGGLRDPLDVKLLPNGNLIVSELKNSSLNEYTKEGILVDTYPTPSPPVDIFIDIDGAIYVATNSGGIFKADSEWNFSLFVYVPGNLADMVRLGEYFYVVSWPGALYRVDPKDQTHVFLFSDLGGGYVGLTVLGNDLLITEYSRNKIIQVSNLMSTPTVTDFAVDLTRASHFATDGKGNFILSHQKTPGGFSKITSSGEASTYLANTDDLTNPRGFVFSSGVIEVTIDIKPGSDPNSINLSSAGVIPVAILSTLDFNAPEEVDPETVMLAGAAIKVAGKSGKYLSHAEDVNDDGLPDLVCQILITEEWEIVPGDTSAELTAETYDGQSIHGVDDIRIVPDK